MNSLHAQGIDRLGPGVIAEAHAPDGVVEAIRLADADAFTLAVMAMGGQGVVSVVSNETPADMASLVGAALGGDFDTARAVHERLFPLMQINFIESNPIPVKAVMTEMGLLSAATYRLPLVPPGAAACPEIKPMRSNSATSFLIFIMLQPERLSCTIISTVRARNERRRN